jgi:hypothetical protein
MPRRERRKKPKFPRRKWRPGQQERTQPPKKGRGSSYRRPAARRRAQRDAEEAGESG